MRILWLRWKDTQHPEAGGAEVVFHELAKRLVADGHSVMVLTTRYPGCAEKTQVDGIEIRRVGWGRLSHFICAFFYYAIRLRGRFDFVIEEVNTIAYGIGFLVPRRKVILFYHMLCREVWFYAIGFPWNWIGYCAEPVYTWIQSRLRAQVITVSKSTQKDMMRFGFKQSSIAIINEGIQNAPLSALPHLTNPSGSFIVLYHGSLRPMKRPEEVIAGFADFIRRAGTGVQAHLWISGEGDQIHLDELADSLGIDSYLTFFGKVDEQKKLKLMREATVSCITSVKEGWGLVITEANSMGTLVIGYDVDGVRDALSFGNGFVVEPNSKALGAKLYDLYEMTRHSPEEYDRLREQALASSRLIQFDIAYQKFIHILNTLPGIQ